MPEEQKPTVEEVERLLLEGIDSGLPSRLGRGPHGIVSEVLKRYPGDAKPSRLAIAEAVWDLVARGLAYLDFTIDPESTYGSGTETWSLYLTGKGRAAAGDQTINPDMPQGYLEQFARDIPQAPDIVQKYVKEALETYTQSCYMACAVMLGVAAEAAFLDVTTSFCRYLKPGEATKLLAWVNGTWRPYDKIREEFMRRLAPYRCSLPDPIKENLDIQVTAIFELIRKYRNDAGHPTGFAMDRGSCFLSLIAFAEAAKRLYALKDFFDGNRIS